MLRKCFFPYLLKRITKKTVFWSFIYNECFTHFSTNVLLNLVLFLCWNNFSYKTKLLAQKTFLINFTFSPPSRQPWCSCHLRSSSSSCSLLCGSSSACSSLYSCGSSSCGFFSFIKTVKVVLDRDPERIKNWQLRSFKTSSKCHSFHSRFLWEM